MLDLNKNGIPDYEEGWFWKAAWSVVLFARGFAADHTIFARAVDEAEAQRQALLLGAPTK